MILTVVLFAAFSGKLKAVRKWSRQEVPEVDDSLAYALLPGNFHGACHRHPSLSLDGRSLWQAAIFTA